MMRFNDAIFFYLCLPPIIFAAGYNMKRKKFFEHFGYIMLFGLVGTIVCFLTFAFLSWVFVQFDFMQKYNGATG